jgi:hypothetical protein
MRLKLLSTLISMSFPPQPHPQHEPPQNAAPHMTPKLKLTNAAPGGYAG